MVEQKLKLHQHGSTKFKPKKASDFLHCHYKFSLMKKRVSQFLNLIKKDTRQIAMPNKLKKSFFNMPPNSAGILLNSKFVRYFRQRKMFAIKLA